VLQVNLGIWVGRGDPRDGGGQQVGGQFQENADSQRARRRCRRGGDRGNEPVVLVDYQPGVVQQRPAEFGRAGAGVVSDQQLPAELAFQCLNGLRQRRLPQPRGCPAPAAAPELPAWDSRAAFPFSGSRPLITTWAPFPASSRAVSRPMPAVPPVTRATLLSSFIDLNPPKEVLDDFRVFPHPGLRPVEPRPAARYCGKSRAIAEDRYKKFRWERAPRPASCWYRSSTDLSGRPPALLDVGSAETFRDEVASCARRPAATSDGSAAVPPYFARNLPSDRRAD
jgi:general stress protein YciG